MNSLLERASQPPSLWHRNPVLVQLLGLSPVLAVSTTLVHGLALGVATVIVLVLSCLTVSLIHQQINPSWRLAWTMLILASYTSILELLMQWFYFPLFQALGIYLPLICCNCILVIRMETKASKADWKVAGVDAITTGLGFLSAIVILSALRELLTTGSLFNNWHLLLPASKISEAVPAGAVGELFKAAELAPIALILLGLIIALKNVIDHRLGIAGSIAAQDSDQAQATKPVKRARVTTRT